MLARLLSLECSSSSMGEKKEEEKMNLPTPRKTIDPGTSQLEHEMKGPRPGRLVIHFVFTSTPTRPIIHSEDESKIS
jgi:hypothetical protein